MGNICPCPKRKKNKDFAYDVHEETFDIEDRGIGQTSPKNGIHDGDNSVLTDEIHPYDKSTEYHEEQPIQETSNTLNASQKQTQPETKSENKEFEKIEFEKLEGEKLIEKPQEVELVKQEEKPKPTLSNFILKPKAPKKKYNPDDYRFINQTDSFKVKKIDSIKEQQYNIDNCKNCAYFIFDITANVYIDDTENCFIFIGPVESTIFVRNCKNLKIVAITKQFRTYECHNCIFSLYCKSQPVIESSSGLTFSSFSCPIYYEQLSQQLSKKKFEVWNNHWSEIHNFTKKEGEQHYILEQQRSFEEIDWHKAFEEAELQVSQKGNPIPLIIGDLPYEVKQQLLIKVNEGIDDRTIIDVLSGTVILKGNEAVLAGEGKQPKKVILIDALEFLPEKFQEIGTVYTNPVEIMQRKAQWFISFGDERAK